MLPPRVAQVQAIVMVVGISATRTSDELKTALNDKAAVCQMLVCLCD